MLRTGTIIVFVVCVLFLGTRSGYAQAIGPAEYQAGVKSRETTLAGIETSLNAAEVDLQKAEQAFSAVELSGDPDALNNAWWNVNAAVDEWNKWSNAHFWQVREVEEAEKAWEIGAIWLEQYKNDYEAQFDSFAVRDQIARCGTQYCSPTSFLSNERFTVFQPHVLEMVGVHHAYAKGLTGKGVRIAIEDSIVNYQLPEFAGRISFDGAKLTYPVPYGDDPFSDSKLCEQGSVFASPGCEVFSYAFEYGDDSEALSPDQIDTLAVRWVVANYGWPEEGENWYLRNDAHEEGGLFRWTKIPHVTGINDHGTIVASVAAGRDFGVAPGATIIPIATDFSSGQHDQSKAEQTLLQWVKGLPRGEREKLDADLAEQIQSDYAKYDVINRSYGIPLIDGASILELQDAASDWWGNELRNILPRYWRAYMQTGIHPDDRTVVVYAAGNDSADLGHLSGAQIPFYEPHVRGHHLSVMALDHDGRHADYTNFCGALPSDWDAQRWRHRGW